MDEKILSFVVIEFETVQRHPSPYIGNACLLGGGSRGHRTGMIGSHWHTGGSQSDMSTNYVAQGEGIDGKQYRSYLITYLYQNPCLYRKRAFPNDLHLQGLGSMRLQAECFPGSADALS